MYFFTVSSALTRRSSSSFRQLITISFFAPVSPSFTSSKSRLLCSKTAYDDVSDNDHFCFPSLTGNILIVGDGDLSYSVALAKENQAQGDAIITASSLDTKDDIEGKYSQGKINLEILNLDSNVRLKHGLDATEIGNIGHKRVWDSIVWNFPYPANTRCASIKAGSTLLSNFFRNLVPVLKMEGTVYVTLYGRQGDKSIWDVEGISWELDSEFGRLLVTKVLLFDASKIDGYEPKRADIEENIPIKSSFTYVLCLQTEQQASIKDIHFSELVRLESSRSDLYNCYFSQSQAYRCLEEEFSLILGQFWNIYRGSSPTMKSTCIINTLEAISQKTVFNLMALIEDHFKVEEVHTLLDEEGEIVLDQFCKIYKAKFEKNPTV